MTSFLILIEILLSFDYSSAFNKLRHQAVIESAFNLGLRQPLLRLVSSYLDGRHTVIKWLDSMSSARHARGGSGQGTLTSVLFFLITVDRTLVQLGEKIHTLEEDLSVAIRSVARYFVDDLALIISWDSSKFEKINDQLIFRDDGRLKEYLTIIERCSEEAGMQLNSDKTKCVVISNKKGVLIPPAELTSPSGDYVIEQQNSLKLLGCPIEAGLTFKEFVAKRRKSAFQAMWKLRKLSNHGVSRAHLKTIYVSFVRSVLEYGLLAVYPSLLEGQLEKLEQVQRKATRFILGMPPFKKKGDLEYHERLEVLGLQSIKERTHDRYIKFCSSLKDDSWFAHYFKLRPPSASNMTLRKRRPYLPIKATYQKFYRAPITSIVRKLNCMATLPSSTKTQ